MVQIFQYSDYRSYLKAHLVQRIEKNPSYSLRALAQQFGITNSYLSEIFSGKKNLSPESAHRISLKLGLSGREAEYFEVLAQIEVTKDSDLKSALVEKARQLNPDRAVHSLSVDAFRVIADWYHLPIRQLASIEGFEFTPKNIAQRLGITSHEVEAAIERLLRLELLEKDASGRFYKTDTDLLVHSEKPDDGLRRFHRQMLEKAIASIDTQTPAEKYIGSETFAFDPEDLPRIKQTLEECFQKAVFIAEKGSRKTQVYHLGIQFFNLTPERK